MASEQELRTALTELTRTGRAALKSGSECILEGMVTASMLLRGEEVVEFAMALRVAEALLKKETP